MGNPNNMKNPVIVQNIISDITIKWKSSIFWLIGISGNVDSLMHSRVSSVFQGFNLLSAYVLSNLKMLYLMYILQLTNQKTLFCLSCIVGIPSDRIQLNRQCSLFKVMNFCNGHPVHISYGHALNYMHRITFAKFHVLQNRSDASSINSS